MASSNRDLATVSAVAAVRSTLAFLALALSWAAASGTAWAEPTSRDFFTRYMPINFTRHVSRYGDMSLDIYLNFIKIHRRTPTAPEAEARIVFSIPPTSAGAERVFARAKNMFGDLQLSALSDQVETGLLLAENDRVLG